MRKILHSLAIGGGLAVAAAVLSVSGTSSPAHANPAAPEKL